MNLTSDGNQFGSVESTRMATSEVVRIFLTGQTWDRPTSVRPLADILSTASPSTSATALVCASRASKARPRQRRSVSPPSSLGGLCRSGRELGSSVTRRPSAPQKGFIGLVVSAQSSEKRLSGHLDRNLPMLL
ncbi:hypothetical protein Taro_051810 [Colocasia esculenta]|uniref:Uncharacterized protein n=1 Tax=Colocasia esculenta TaxID=4460 RepID=A0A843XHV1_COLES|nr:hypothetical protein [Colocasia esculenta]